MTTLRLTTRTRYKRPALKWPTVSAVQVETFSAVKLRASQPNIPIHTQRKLPEPVVEFDISDEEEVPLSTNTQFTSYRAVILDEKDGLRRHLSLQERIKAMTKEQTLAREWDDGAPKNKQTPAKVVFIHAKKKCDAMEAKKVQQYLLKCISHPLRLLQEESSNPASFSGPNLGKERRPRRPRVQHQPHPRKNNGSTRLEFHLPHPHQVIWVRITNVTTK